MLADSGGARQAGGSIDILWPVIRWILAAIHLLGFGIAVGSIWARARALRQPLDVAGIRRVLSADNWWGVSAILLIGTGLARAFAGFEKGTLYYTHNHFFWLKMGLLLTILLLEILPIVTFIKWRVRLAKGEAIDATRARSFATTSLIQAGLILLMILAATAMARGYGVTN
jgi:putative membrane protein